MFMPSSTKPPTKGLYGASSIPEEDYLNLANEVGDSLADIYTLVWSRALNPADTAASIPVEAEEISIIIKLALSMQFIAR